MKRIFSVALLVAAFTAIYSVCPAKPVPEMVAAIVARNWLAQHNRTIQPAAFVEVTTSIAATLRMGGKYYYLFSADEEKGWVIVAADDVAWPVIAFSPEGHLDARFQPPAFVAWMQQIDRQIALARKTEPQSPSRLLGPVAARIKQAWKVLSNNDCDTASRAAVVYDGSAANRGEVPPMLTTTWYQGIYYNAKCPEDPSAPEKAGGHVWTGCVATAMGQVMKYHNWPGSGTGSHSYDHPEYGTLTADFGATTYGWSSMPEALTDYNDAVATLLYHTGVSVEMDYGVGGSGAYMSDVDGALRNYFRYVADCSRWRDDFPAAKWITLLRNELEGGRPVIYGGYDEKGNSGHAFVCDGYKDSDYFHFNWGWSGYYDGYFYLDDLTPRVYDFSYSQGAVMGIQPGCKPDLVPFDKLSRWTDALPVGRTKLKGGEFHDDAGPFYANEEIYINLALLNRGPVPAGSYMFRFEITGDGGKVFLGVAPSAMEPGSCLFFTNDVSIGTFPAGTHQIRVWLDTDNDVDEVVEDNNSYQRTLTILPGSCSFVIDPDSASFSPVAGSGSIGVTTSSGCSWTATTLVDWIDITSGTTGSGNGTVEFKVAPNASAKSRTATITVAGKIFTVTQEGRTESGIVFVDGDGQCNGFVPCFATVASGYDAAVDSDILRIMTGDYCEELDFAEAKSVTLSGGWNSDYNNATGSSEIGGKLSIAAGCVIIDKMTIASSSDSVTQRAFHIWGEREYSFAGQKGRFGLRAKVPVSD